MENIAVALWVMTAVGGAYMFGITVRSGSRSADARDSHFSSALFWHPVGAIAGLALLLLFLGPAPKAFAWLSFGLLALTAGFGASFAARWWRDRRSPATTRDLAEQQIPVMAVVAHGVLALATLAAVLTTALTA